MGEGGRRGGRRETGEKTIDAERYPQTDVFLLCFNVDDESHFNEVWDGVCHLPIFLLSFPLFRSSTQSNFIHSPSQYCFLSPRCSIYSFFLQWYYEIDRYCPSAPIVLVGTKSDLRHTSSVCTPVIIFYQLKTNFLSRAIFLILFLFLLSSFFLQAGQCVHMSQVQTF